MPRGGANFSSEELVRVLSHYDVGVIHQIKSLSGGNRRSPKMVVVSEQGKFLLKRRPHGKDDLARVAFAHAVQTHLAARAFPVTSLIATRSDNNTILQLNSHIYELFKFVSGVRYDGSSEAGPIDYSTLIRACVILLLSTLAYCALVFIMQPLTKHTTS